MLAQLVKRELFQAELEFSSQENMFGVVFNLGKTAAHSQCKESFGQPLGSFAFGL